MASLIGKTWAATVVALALSATVTFVGVSADGAEAQGFSSGEAVVAEAQGWIGVPYVYGGASYSGVDCSGLTQQVLAPFGVSLPHSAAGQ